MARLRSPVPMTKLYFKTDYDTGDEKQVVAVMGSISELGHWEVTNCLITSRDHSTSITWTAELMLPSGMGFQWKWAVLSSVDHRMIRWEERIDRHFQVPKGDCVIYALWNSDFEKIPVERDNENTKLNREKSTSSNQPNSTSGEEKKARSLTPNGITQFKPVPVPSAIVTSTCLRSPKKVPETCEKHESDEAPIRNMMAWCSDRKRSLKTEMIREDKDSSETLETNLEPESNSMALLSPTKSYSSPVVAKTDHMSRGSNETETPYDPITIASPIRQSNSFVTVYRRIGDFVMSNIIRDLPCSIL